MQKLRESGTDKAKPLLFFGFGNFAQSLANWQNLANCLDFGGCVSRKNLNLCPFTFKNDEQFTSFEN